MGTGSPGQNSPGSAFRNAAGLAGLLRVPPAPISSLDTALLSPGVSHRAQGSCAAHPVLPGPTNDHKVQGQTCSCGAVWRAKTRMRGARWGTGRTDRWQQGLVCTSHGAVWLRGHSSLLHVLRIVHCPHGLDALILSLFSCLVLLCPSVLSRNDTSSKKPSLIATKIHPLSLPLLVGSLALSRSVVTCWFVNFGSGLSVLMLCRFCVGGSLWPYSELCSQRPVKPVPDE